jgi:hypothetical protein
MSRARAVLAAKALAATSNKQTERGFMNPDAKIKGATKGSVFPGFSLPSRPGSPGTETGLVWLREMLATFPRI